MIPHNAAICNNFLVELVCEIFRVIQMTCLSIQACALVRQKNSQKSQKNIQKYEAFIICLYMYDIM